MINFLLAVRARYRSVPYHNFYHAFDVFQTLWLFLKQGGLLEKFTPVEVFVLLVVGLAHDVDHAGLNNTFHLKTDSPLGIVASATGSRSVLEIHHCQVAIEILSVSKNDITACLPHHERSLFFKRLVDLVLATDMSRHKEFLSEYSALPAFDYTKDSHRHLLMVLLVTAADISNISKPFEIARQWGIQITTEFYDQGDAEREEGLEVTPMFDRERKQELATGQIGFSRYVGLPLFHQLKRLVPQLDLTGQIEENIQMWEKVLAAEVSLGRGGK